MGFCGDQDFCDGLVHNLSDGSLEDLSLDGDVDRPGSSGGGSIRDIKKTSIRDVKKIDKKVLYLCDSPIEVFYTIFYLSNYVFFRFQILQYYGNYLKNPP